METALSSTENISELIASEPLSVADIQDWLAVKMGEQLGIDANYIENDTPFSAYGLSSAQAMAIAQSGKQRFGLEISPLIMWNCPTIDALSRHIVDELSRDDSESFEI